MFGEHRLAAFASLGLVTFGEDSMHSKPPVLIIGIDGATWEVINPLLASGRLPTIARLMREGTSGALRSNTNYASPALWTSITTGKRPEKHGVLDFYSATRPHLRCSTLYDILEGCSGRVGLFRWFATWPPAQNRGFTVPSAIARSPETYPADLAFLNELAQVRAMDDYLRHGLHLVRHGARLPTLVRSVAQAAYEKATRPKEWKWLYRRQLIEAAIHADVFAYLLRQQRPQFAALLLTLTDDLSHRYWKYREPKLFKDVSPAEVRRYGHVIDAAYTTVDQAIGAILHSVPEDALIVILSDHGQQAGPALPKPFIMSQSLLHLLGCHDRIWLTHIGYRSYLRPRRSQDGQGTLEELKGLLGQIGLQPDGVPVFQVLNEETARLAVEVSVPPDTRLESAVSLPGGQVTSLGAIVFDYGHISGHHSEYGVLIMRGPRVRKGHRVEGASIFDITPTVLALKNRPVGRDMDGQVIVDAVEESFLQENPVRYIASYETEERVQQEMPYTDTELENLEARLRTLGYLS